MQPEVNESTARTLRERPSISCANGDKNLSVSKNPQKTNSLNGTVDSLDVDSILDVLPESTDQLSDSHMKDDPGGQEKPKENKSDKLKGGMAKQVDLDDIVTNPYFPVQPPRPLRASIPKNMKNGPDIRKEYCEPHPKNRKGRRKTNPEVPKKQPESRKSAPLCNSSRVPEEPSFTVNGINFLESLMTEKKRKRRRPSEIPSSPIVPTRVEPPSAGVGAMAAALNSVFKGLVPTVFTRCPVQPKHNTGNSEPSKEEDPMVIRPLILDEVTTQSTASEPILARLKAEQIASNCPSNSRTESVNKRLDVRSPSIAALKPEPPAE